MEGRAFSLEYQDSEKITSAFAQLCAGANSAVQNVVVGSWSKGPSPRDHGACRERPRHMPALAGEALVSVMVWI